MKNFKENFIDLMPTILLENIHYTLEAAITLKFFFKKSQNKIWVNLKGIKIQWRVNL